MREARVIKKKRRNGGLNLISINMLSFTILTLQESSLKYLYSTLSVEINMENSIIFILECTADPPLITIHFATVWNYDNAEKMNHHCQLRNANLKPTLWSAMPVMFWKGQIAPVLHRSPTPHWSSPSSSASYGLCEAAAGHTMSSSQGCFALLSKLLFSFLLQISNTSEASFLKMCTWFRAGLSNSRQGGHMRHTLAMPRPV